jgi:NADH dehydrogenase
VIVGGGATGVEMAGSIAEIASRTIAADFRNIDTSKTRIVLVEAADALLRAMPESLRARCKAELERMGVEHWVTRGVVGPESQQIFMYDPFGNMIELHQAGTCRCIASNRQPVRGMS